jgi:hypothetical protein
MRLMRAIWVVTLAATSCLLPSRTASACIGRPLDIPELVKNADLIAVGTVTSVTDTGPASRMAFDVTGRMMTGALRVDEVLKGPPALKEVHFRFVRTESDCRYGEVPEGRYRIVFLNSENGAYELTRVDWPSVVAVPAATSDSTDALDRVYHVIASVLTSPTTTRNDKGEAIFTLNFQRGNDETNAALRLLSEGVDPLLMANAVAVLINSGDLSVLPTAERLLSQPVTDRTSEGLANIRGAIIN